MSYEQPNDYLPEDFAVDFGGEDWLPEMEPVAESVPAAWEYGDRDPRSGYMSEPCSLEELRDF